MKVLIVAGGTAGHTIPALSVADELKAEDKNTEILFVTTRKAQDKKLIFDRGYRSKKIFSGKLRRYFSLFNFIDPFFIVIGFLQSLYIVLRFRPNVVFSKGGYLSLPTVFAAKLFLRKVVVHESDLKMGLANKVSAKFSNKILVSFDKSNYKNINQSKLVYTGNPIKKITKTKKRLDGKTIFYWGGSQGSLKMNNILIDSIKEITLDYNIVHLTGTNDFKRISKLRSSMSEDILKKYKAFPAVFNDNDFSRLINEADIIVSRAGASSIFETAYLGKALILVPLPGHQEENANYLAAQKAALVIKNEDLSKNVLIENLDKLKNNSEEKRELEENILKLSMPNSTALVAAEIRTMVS